MQFAARDRREAVVFYFRNAAPETVRRVKLRGLESKFDYEIVRLNSGSSEHISGDTLMQSGLEVALSQDPEESEILLLKSTRVPQ